MGPIGSTSPDLYAGLGIFRPLLFEQLEAAQNAKDQQRAADAVAPCEKVKTFSQGRISALVSFEQWLQVQQLPIDTNRATELENSRLGEQNVQTLAETYQGAVNGW